MGNDFDEDSDPHGEHDFGVVEIAGHEIMFKIAYYDRTELPLARHIKRRADRSRHLADHRPSRSRLRTRYRSEGFRSGQITT
jgi:hypothetical protein